MKARLRPIPACAQRIDFEISAGTTLGGSTVSFGRVVPGGAIEEGAYVLIRDRVYHVERSRAGELRIKR